MANYSLGEIDALARKATRGAGYSWGIAEEAGKAVRWLSAYGFSGAETLANYLSLVANKPQDFIPQLQNNSAKSDADLKNAIAFANNNASLCPLYGGTLINDLGHQLQVNKTLSFDNMLFPLLALSQAGRIAEAYDINVSFSYADKVIICNATGIQLNDTPPLIDAFYSADKADVVCQRFQSDLSNTHFPSPQSRSISAAALIILEQLAHTTYAPATEESRLKGAG